MYTVRKSKYIESQSDNFVVPLMYFGAAGGPNTIGLTKFISNEA